MDKTWLSNLQERAENMRECILIMQNAVASLKAEHNELLHEIEMKIMATDEVSYDNK